MQTIHFQITKGDAQYVAEGVEASIITQGYSLDELMKNIKEATELYFEDESIEP
jgi:predicted RNase H-like HicB family nuclease